MVILVYLICLTEMFCVVIQVMLNLRHGRIISLITENDVSTKNNEHFDCCF